jgi:hypothetical protein
MAVLNANLDLGFFPMDHARKDKLKVVNYMLLMDTVNLVKNQYINNTLVFVYH